MWHPIKDILSKRLTAPGSGAGAGRLADLSQSGSGVGKCGGGSFTPRLKPP